MTCLVEGGVCEMHDGAACESEWQIHVFIAFCAFSTTDGLSLPLSLSLPPSTFACCVHKASRIAPTIPGSVMSEGKFVV